MNQTNRITVKEIDDILGQTFPILDKGFIRVVDYMGGDHSVVQAARVSYGQGTKTTRQDKGLIEYLMKHKHTSPFEMCEIKLHIKLPIFVARQWVRHRTASINEISARYSILTDDYYVPSAENIAKQSSNNKQGRGETLNPNEAEEVIKILNSDAERCYENYLKMLGQEGSENGIAREIARVNLTLNFYTEWYWKIDLHNLLHFLNLRMHPHAQYEIRAYAEQMFNIAKLWCPISVGAFDKHVRNSTTFSQDAIKLIKEISKHGIESDWFRDFENNISLNLEKFNLTKREYEEILIHLKD
jgi:thymidylate synthase (FAD)